jgi:hypothetical protein
VRLGLVALLPLALGCSSPTAPDVVGAWGGAQASLVLGPSGGTVSYLCGAGTIDATWTVNADGRFVASGEHFFGGGPMPVGGATPHPARYDGRVVGDRLTLTVAITDLNETLGPFDLMRGGPAVHEICL